jgi:predicted SAM-dependent methyltransferase
MEFHLGCGERSISGYEYIDAIDFAHVDHVETLAHLSSIGDDSTGVISNCPVLEHFERSDVSRVLQEWRGVRNRVDTLGIS